MGMKHFYRIMITALGTVALSSVVAFGATGQATGTNVNVRAAADTSTAVLTQINQGTSYEVLGADGNWVKISVNGKEGYVYGEYFQVNSAEGTVTGSGVNIRSGASTSTSVLGSANKGDSFTATALESGFYKINYNGGTGYISQDYFSGTYLKYLSSSSSSSNQVYGVVTAETGLKLRAAASTSSDVITVLPYGTEFDIVSTGSEWLQVKTDVGQSGYVSADYVSVKSGTRTSRSNSSSQGQAVVDYAKQFIGTPYVWGGTDLNNGVDCSGFVYSVYKHFGITLNRSSYTMVNHGVEVAKANLQPGDLVFFNSGSGTSICHVGIYIGGNQYIHSTDGAAYGVTITSLSSDYSARTYVTARRILR